MTQFAFPPAPQSALPIYDSEALFPVRRIYCVGRNYSEHAIEMGHDPDREPPFFFSKPADAATPSGAQLPFPRATQNLHHEAELVVAIGAEAQDIAPDEAEKIIWGFATGNDLTRRDLQSEAKSRRRPWDMAKGFDQAAIIGLLHPVSDCGMMTNGKITAHVDGDLRQTGDLADMIWPTRDVIAYLSQLVCLKPGDLIMTGTPAGVGPIMPGQSCTIAIDGLTPATVSYQSA